MYYVRRPSNQPYGPRYVHLSTKNSPSVMVWGAISCQGPAGIHLLEPGQTMNSAQYIEIIADHLPRWMTFLSCNIYQQDGAPCHQLKCTKQWFERNNINLLAPWPGSSPDLNPIEIFFVFIEEKGILFEPKLCCNPSKFYHPSLATRNNPRKLPSFDTLHAPKDCFCTGSQKKAYQILTWCIFYLFCC